MGRGNKLYTKTGKRVLDLMLAVLMLLPFAAISVVICIISLLVFKGKIFFFQERLGYRNKVFRLFKFATLLPEEQDGKIRTIAERQTAWGDFLRDYSLDELPQLINILKGEMSFVGPRPLLPEYKNLYTPREAVRHEVKPGLTGLAQVNGRNSLSWNEKMQYDQQYVANLCFVSDLEILLKTAGVVLEGQAVSFGKGPEKKLKELKWRKS